MKIQYFEVAKAQSLNHARTGLAVRLSAVFRSLTRPAATQHIGMFAGSLLSYDAWGEPKAPH